MKLLQSLSILLSFIAFSIGAVVERSSEAVQVARPAVGFGQKSYYEDKNYVRALQAISRKRFYNAVKTLPAAVTILDSIVEDKSLNARQIGVKVGSLVRSLNSDTASALLTLQRLFAPKPSVNRFRTYGNRKVNYFQKGSKVVTNDKQPFKKLVMPLENYGMFKKAEEKKEFSGPKKLVMPLAPTTTTEQKTGSESTTVLATTDIQASTVVPSGRDTSTVPASSDPTTVPATTDIQTTTEVPATTVSL